MTEARTRVREGWTLSLFKILIVCTSWIFRINFNLLNIALKCYFSWLLSFWRLSHFLTLVPVYDYLCVYTQAHAFVDKHGLFYNSSCKPAFHLIYHERPPSYDYIMWNQNKNIECNIWPNKGTKYLKSKLSQKIKSIWSSVRSLPLKSIIEIYCKHHISQYQPEQTRMAQMSSCKKDHKHKMLI